MAQLRQEGLQQAQQRADKQYQQQLGLGITQQDLASNLTKQLGQTGTGAQGYSQSLLDAQRSRALLGQEYPTQRIQQAANIFGSLVSAVPGAPPAPIMTSPGIAGLQGFAGTYNLLGNAPAQGLQTLSGLFR